MYTDTCVIIYYLPPITRTRKILSFSILLFCFICWNPSCSSFGLFSLRWFLLRFFLCAPMPKHVKQFVISHRIHVWYIYQHSESLETSQWEKKNEVENSPEKDDGWQTVFLVASGKFLGANCWTAMAASLFFSQLEIRWTWMIMSWIHDPKETFSGFKNSFNTYSYNLHNYDIYSYNHWWLIIFIKLDARHRGWFMFILKIGTSGLCGESFSLLRRSAACRRRVPGAFVQTNPNHKRQRESQKNAR